jgi:hypothetical protein
MISNQHKVCPVAPGEHMSLDHFISKQLKMNMQHPVKKYFILHI